MNMLDEALACAERGWRVFRVNGKRPDRRGWQRRATTDPSTVREMLADADGYAIATGRPSGLVVLDIDPKNGGDETIEDLEREHGKLPETPTVLTGGDGRHLYFLIPDERIKNSVGSIGKGLDVRIGGGFVVGPGSLHESGRRYEWEISSHPDDVPLADVPTWLLDLMRGKRRAGNAKAGATASAGVRSSRQLLRALYDVPQGRRNTSLFLMSSSLRGRGTPVDVIEDLVLLAAEHCRPPLPEHEAMSIVSSVANNYRPNDERDRRGPTSDRVDIMSYIVASGGRPVGPAEISRHYDWNVERTKKTMQRMVKYGELTRLGRDGYLMGTVIDQLSPSGSRRRHS